MINLKIKTVVISLYLTLTLAACGDDNNSSSSSKSKKSKASLGNGSFTVKINGETKFDSDSDRAKIHYANDDIIGLQARDWYFRATANGLPDAGAGKSTDLGRNNTMFHGKFMIDGKSQKVGCDPAKEPRGQYNRTAFSEQSISGDISIEFIACNDYYSAESVAVPGLPFTVDVTFEDLPITINP